jgi:ABC-type spermidine/putrescine transport system permease subunit I
LWFNIPFATMMILAGLSSIPDSMIESARDVGASRRAIFTKMIVPLTMKDVMIAATFIFMSNVGAFTTPYLMGSTFPQMIGVSLFVQFNNLNYGNAAALSVIMFLLCSVSAAVYIYTNMREKAWEKQE